MTVQTRSMKKKMQSNKIITIKKNVKTFTLKSSTVKPVAPKQNPENPNPPPAIRLTEKDLFERKFIVLNEERISNKYLKVHPITKKRIYDKGRYWERYVKSKHSDYRFYDNNGYVDVFSEEFEKIDKEYINKYDGDDRQILATCYEFDVLLWTAKNFDTEVKNYWFLAPEGYYWKWYHERCVFDFDWVQLEKIENFTN
jgi:hypothetical protein